MKLEWQGPSATGAAEREASPRCGYVAIVGRPNVGKSSLLNALLGQKLSITSRKPQTTRRNLLGIDTRGACQAIYVDTPGMREGAVRALDRRMQREAASVLADVQLIAVILDRDRWTDRDQAVLKRVRSAGTQALAVINKLDLLSDPAQALPIIERMAELRAFAEILPLSALKRQGIEAFRQAVFNRLPAGPHLFPPHQMTDRSERFLVGEIVREKLVRRLGDELPHRTEVRIVAFDISAQVADISGDILVERAGQKRIVIGQQGRMLKSIGQDARLDIERLLGRRVMLRLWVKVHAGWSKRASGLEALDREYGSLGCGRA